MRISDWSSDVCSSDLRRCHSCSCSVNSLGLYPNRLLTDFNYTPVASRQVGITRLPSWRYLCLESIRPRFGHLEHAVGEAPFVVAPHEQIGNAAAVDPRSEECRVGKECVSACISRGAW